MIRAYHFLLGNMRSDEDVIAGNARPWRVGETRNYHGVRIDAGEYTVEQLGYHSSRTLWSALQNADGPVACLVEVSEPLSIRRTRFGQFQISRQRRLINARDVSAELRLFGCECATRVLHLYERRYQSAAPRKAVEAARHFALGDCSQAELKVAFRSAREAAGAATNKARIAAWAATATAFDDASNAALAASWGAFWAGGRAERDCQRRRFKSLGQGLFPDVDCNVSHFRG
jgi:hypothetical protein